MMFAMNAFSTGFLSLLLIASGELAAFFRFIAAYPTVLQQIILFSVSGAVGQVLEYYYFSINVLVLYLHTSP